MALLTGQKGQPQLAGYSGRIYGDFSAKAQVIILPGFVFRVPLRDRDFSVPVRAREFPVPVRARTFMVRVPILWP